MAGCGILWLWCRRKDGGEAVQVNSVVTAGSQCFSPRGGGFGFRGTRRESKGDELSEFGMELCIHFFPPMSMSATTASARMPMPIDELGGGVAGCWELSSGVVFVAAFDAGGGDPV